MNVGHLNKILYIYIYKNNIYYDFKEKINLRK